MGLGGTCCLPRPPAGPSLLGCPAFWGCSRSPRLPLFRQRRRGPGTSSRRARPLRGRTHTLPDRPPRKRPRGGGRDTVGGILRKSPGGQTRGRGELWGSGGLQVCGERASRCGFLRAAAAALQPALCPPPCPPPSPARSPPALLGATVSPRAAGCHRHPLVPPSPPSLLRPVWGPREGRAEGLCWGAPMGTGGRSPPRPQGMEEGRERWPRRGHCSGPCPLPVLARGSAHPVDALGVPLRSPCGATRAPDVFLGLRSPRVSATLLRSQLLLWVFWGTETLSVPRGRCGCPLLASAREPRGGCAGRTG